MIARLHCLLKTISIKGIQKAAVFPVPVCADPRTSFKFNINGIALTCIGVGLLKLIFAKDVFKSLCKLSS